MVFEPFRSFACNVEKFLCQNRNHFRPVSKSKKVPFLHLKTKSFHFFYFIFFNLSSKEEASWFKAKISVFKIVFLIGSIPKSSFASSGSEIAVSFATFSILCLLILFNFSMIKLWKIFESVFHCIPITTG